MNRTIKAILIVFFIILVNTASAINTYTTVDYAIELPSGWRFDKGNDDGTVLTFTSEGGYAWVIISVYSSAGMSPAQILKDEREYLIEKKGYPSYEEDVNINGLRGVRWRYTDYYEGVAYQNHRVILLAEDKYYTITASTRESNTPKYFLDFEQIFNSFKTKGVPTVKAKPTDDILNFKIISESNNKLVFTVDYAYNSNHGDNVWLGATALQGTNEFLWFSYRPAKAKRGEGTATITLGYDANNPPPSVSTNQIKVEMYVGGEYSFYSKNFDYVKTWYAQAPAPTPTYTPEQRDSTSGIIGVVFILIVISGIVLAFKAAKRRPATPAIEPAPMRHAPAQYPAAPKKQEPAAKPQANELKELKEKLLKTNQLLDKLDERLVNGELTEAKYRELAGKYKAEADSLKNQIAEKELLSEVGLKIE